MRLGILCCVPAFLCACSAGVDDETNTEAIQEPAGQTPAGQAPNGQDSTVEEPAAQDLAGQEPAAQDPQGTTPAPTAQEMSLLSWFWCANPGGPGDCATRVEQDASGFLSHRFSRGDTNMDVFTHHHFDFTAVASQLQLRARASREIDVILALRYEQEQTYWDSVAEATPWKSVTVHLTEEAQDHVVPLESLRDPGDQGGGTDSLVVHVLVADAGDVQLTIEDFSLLP